MKLLLDECVSPRVARALLEPGIEAANARELGLIGKSDRVIWVHANQYNYCVLSHDADFLELATKPPYSAKRIWFKQSNLSRQQIATHLISHKAELDAFAEDAMARVLELR
jgi:predicted nuclease of predicted toxin-antitoxin system